MKIKTTSQKSLLTERDIFKLLQIAAIIWISVVYPTQAQVTRTLTQWTVPTEESGPVNVVMVSERHAFFAEEFGEAIGKLDVRKNTITEWFIPGSRPHGIVRFGDAVVYCDYGRSTISMLDPKFNRLTEWQLPSTMVTPLHPAQKGNTIFFASRGVVASLDITTNVITEWFLQIYDVVNGIEARGDGVFYTQQRIDIVGRLAPESSTLTEWTIGLGSFPQHLRSSGKFIFFNERDGGRIGRLDASTNTITEWTVPTEGGGPVDVEPLNTGFVYFTEIYGDKIGQLDTTAEPGTDTVVMPLVTVVTPVKTTVTPAVTTLSPVTTSVTPVETDLTAQITGGFLEWEIPTQPSGPIGISKMRGVGAIFCDSQGNKIGIFR